MTPEEKKLLADALDWQKQYYALMTAVKALGYEVYYDDQGKPELEREQPCES